MAVRQRGDSFQVDITINGRRMRKDFNSIEAAEEWELLVKQKLRRGEALDEPGGGTMADLLESTQARHWSNTRGEHTAVANAQVFVDFVGEDTIPSSISATTIDQFVLHLRKPWDCRTMTSWLYMP